MNFELTGNLIVKEDTVEISQSFKKREFVIEVANEKNSDWNDFIKFQATQDRCNLLEGINLGDKVKVNFNIKGRKWEKEGKTNYFNNLEAWRIQKVENETAHNNSMPDYNTDDVPLPEPPDDDLPF